MIQLLMNLFRRLSAEGVRKSFGTLLFFVSVFVYATTGFMYFELEQNPDLTWMDAAWWAVVTMTTVGYGDYFPVTQGGRLFVGLPSMLLGVSLLGYLLSLLAMVIVEHRMKEIRGRSQMQMTDHIILCHYTSLETTLQLVRELRADVMTTETPVVLIDEHLDEIPEELRKENVFFVKGDPARSATLEQADFRHCKYLLLQADSRDLSRSDMKNLTIALTIEKLAPHVHTVVHCVEPENVEYFGHTHVNSVICPSALSRQLMVQELQDPGTHSVIFELTSNLDGKQFYVVDAPPDVKTIGEARAHYAKQSSLLVGVRRDGKSDLLPSDDNPIQSDEKLILIAARRPAETPRHVS